MMEASEIDIAWAAGLFEGEGYCGFYKRERGTSIAVKLSMTDADTVRRFYEIVGVGNLRDHQPPGKKRVWCWQTSARDDVLSVLGRFWPYLGERRQQRATEVIERAVKMRDVDWQGGRRRQTHCKRGHELTDENLYRSTVHGKPVRQCRICKRAAWARENERRKAVPVG